MQRRFTLAAVSLVLIICTACRSVVGAGISQSLVHGEADVPQSTASLVSDIKTESSLPVLQPSENELRGIWIAFFELYPMFDNDFEAAFSQVLDKCVASGFNTVFVHVRSHCDAFYESKLFPWSGYCNKNGGVQGVNPGFDPLKIMIRLAHERGLEFHAWINPYRVLNDSADLDKLADSNPAKVWLTDGNAENDSNVTAWDNGLYLNPAEAEVQQLIADGVREIVANYEVDGIHFDDYFYPTTDALFDEAQYAEYRTSVSSNPLELADWRRANVNVMISTVYNAVKSERANCVFGISPMASISNNYNTVYADCAKWLEYGIVDYIIPQLYFGFEYADEKYRFDSLLSDWRKLFFNKPQQLYIGLGSYRVGSNADGFTEWSESSDILSRQIELLRSDVECDGFAVYSVTTFYKNDELSVAVRDSVEKTIGNVNGE